MKQALFLILALILAASGAWAIGTSSGFGSACSGRMLMAPQPVTARNGASNSGASIAAQGDFSC